MTDKQINITASTVIYYIVFGAIITLWAIDAISFDTTVIAALLNSISSKLSVIEHSHIE